MAPPTPEPEATHLLRLEIENVRCFGPRQTLDLSDGKGKPAKWTMLLGDNGVGKTTLLQCVVHLMDKVWSPERHALHRSFQRSPNSSARAWLWGQTFHAEFSTGGDRPGVRSETDPDGWPLVLLYTAARRMDPSSTLQGDPPPPPVDLLNEEVALKNAEEWLIQADYAAKSAPERPELRRRFEAVRTLLINLLPDVADFQIAGFDTPIPRARVEARTPYGWVHLAQLSLGYRTLMAWVVDLAGRMFDLYLDTPNPLHGPAVVLVDEIDLHLHPTWQRRIIQYLDALFPNVQFIVTAHSPLIVQAAAAANANVAVLRREGDHVVIDNNPKAVMGWRVDQILTSDLFGLTSARPAALDPLLEERQALLNKALLSDAEEARLKAIRAELEALPYGESPAEIRARELIERAARRLETQGEG